MTEITAEILSPNNNQILRFYDSIEPRMGMTMSKFSWTNLLTKDKIRFPGIRTIGHTTSWSDNSSHFSLSIGRPFHCFLIVDTTTKQFSIIVLFNVWDLKSKCYNDNIEIELSGAQIPEIAELGKHQGNHFTKPNSLILPFNQLKWFAIDRLKNFKRLKNEVEQLNLKPIEND